MAATIPATIMKNKSKRTAARENKGPVFSERTKWIRLIEKYVHFSNADLVPPFFGKMAKKQIGYFVYKHTDHHLRQFNSWMKNQ